MSSFQAFDSAGVARCHKTLKRLTLEDGAFQACGPGCVVEDRLGSGLGRSDANGKSSERAGREARRTELSFFRVGSVAGLIKGNRWGGRYGGNESWGRGAGETDDCLPAARQRIRVTTVDA